MRFLRVQGYFSAKKNQHRARLLISQETPVGVLNLIISRLPQLKVKFFVPLLGDRLSYEDKWETCLPNETAE